MNLIIQEKDINRTLSIFSWTTSEGIIEIISFHVSGRTRGCKYLGLPCETSKNWPIIHIERFQKGELVSKEDINGFILFIKLVKN